MKLNGRVAIITGCTGGIGRSVAKHFAKEGAKVVVHYASNEREAHRLVDEIEKLGSKAIAVKVDFSKKGTVERDVVKMVKRTIDIFGRIDILVCLAGRTTKGLWDKRALDYTREDFYSLLDIDVYGSFLCCKAVAPHMLQQQKGVIIMTGSNIAISGYGAGFGWIFSKAANIGMAKSLAVELAPCIRVNAIAPGNIATEWVSDLGSEEREQAAREALLQRLGDPEDIANLLVFLASEDSSFINGQTIIVDGGAVVR